MFGATAASLAEPVPKTMAAAKKLAAKGTKLLEEYAAAKARLFAWPGLRAAVVNGDDPACVPMLAAIAGSPGSAPVLRIAYGFSPGQHGARVDRMLLADRVIEDAQGITLSLAGDYGRADLRLHLLGRLTQHRVFRCLGPGLQCVGKVSLAIEPQTAQAQGRRRQPDLAQGRVGGGLHGGRMEAHGDGP